MKDFVISGNEVWNKGIWKDGRLNAFYTPIEKIPVNQLMSLRFRYKDEIDFWDEVLTPGKRHPWMDDMLIPEKRAQLAPMKFFD